MTRSRFLVPALALVLIAPAQAQAPVEPVTASEWSAPRSRALFASLDEDGNDRIDLLEAAGLKTLAGVTDLDSFRRLDGNRDGHLDQEEFDAHFRDLLAHGQVLRLRPARPEVLTGEDVSARAANPAEELLPLFDDSGDGSLDRSELDRLLRQAGVPDPDILLSQFDRLDRDRSGTLATAELERFLDLLPMPGIARLVASSTDSGLPHGFDSHDLDRNGRMDRAELSRFLRRLDPSLQHWERAIFERADLDGNGALDAAEIARSSGQDTATPAASRRSEM